MLKCGVRKMCQGDVSVPGSLISEAKGKITVSVKNSTLVFETIIYWVTYAQSNGLHRTWNFPLLKFGVWGMHRFLSKIAVQFMGSTWGQIKFCNSHSIVYLNLNKNMFQKLYSTENVILPGSRAGNSLVLVLVWFWCGTGSKGPSSEVGTGTDHLVP